MGNHKILSENEKLSQLYAQFSFGDEVKFLYHAKLKVKFELR